VRQRALAFERCSYNANGKLSYKPLSDKGDRIRD
jgi:hypothetical protein